MAHPAINFGKLTVDPERLERALGYVASPMAGHHGCFYVERRNRRTGEDDSHTYHVDLISGDVPRCDCGDHLYREQLCKHILCALMAVGNETIAHHLAEMLRRRRGIDG